MIPCTLSLPWPPSENAYRRAAVINGSPRQIISKDGRAYKMRVRSELFTYFAGRAPAKFDLTMAVILYPPNRRKIDLDNRLKALQDALEAAGVYEDDSQIKRLQVELGEVTPDGRALVRLEPWGDGPQAFPKGLVELEAAGVVA